MNIVIVGIGKIGETVLADLAGEDYKLTIIDEDKNKVEQLIEAYDVLGVVGNGACLNIQLEAGVNNADLFIALTNSDELNILACLVAKKAGAPNTIARVRNPDYRRQILLMKDELGISMILNPEKEAANEIFQLINLPSVAQIESFARGRVTMVAIVIEKGCSLIGETLISVSKKLRTKVLICAIQRGEQVFIPSGNFIIREGDKIHFTAAANSLGDFLTEINLTEKPLKHIMIVGGGRIGYYLADVLSKKKYRVKLIENNANRAEKIADELNKVTVIAGDGTSHPLLAEEGIEAMDAFVMLTGVDEENIIASMYANKKNVRRIIAKIDREELLSLLDDNGAYSSVSPKDVTATLVLRYIRALANKRGSNIITLYRLVNNQVEALEFIAKCQENIYHKQLKTLKIKENCLIACIIRNNEVIIPDGNSCICPNDNVIVVTTHKNFDDLTDIFA